MSEARTFTVGEDDDGIRLDRWFKRHLPDLSFNVVSRWARTGQIRVNGKRVETEVPTNRLLVDCLRYDLGLTGTKVGATTWHFTSSAVNCQYSTYPVGPAS